MTESSQNQVQVQQTHSAGRWLLASLPLWGFAGLGFLLIPAMIFSAPHNLARFLIDHAGLSEALAFRIAAAALHLPVTVLMAALVGAVQCGVLPAVRPWAGRWILAAVAGALASAATWAVLLPLVDSDQPATSFDVILRMLSIVLRGATLAAFVALAQRWSMRGRVLVPVWFVILSLLAGGAGSFAFLAFALAALGGLR